MFYIKKLQFFYEFHGEKKNFFYFEKLNKWFQTLAF